MFSDYPGRCSLDLDAEWPLVGRDDEISRLRELLGDGLPGAVLAGTAGTGKTRLSAHCLEGSGRRILRVTATGAGSAVPFGVLATRLTGLRALRTDTPGYLAESTRRVADRLLGDGCEVLVVDDAHLLDDASAGLVLQLARGGAAQVLVVVDTVAPAPAALTTLWKDRVVGRLDLAPLPAEDLHQLLCLVLGGWVDKGTAGYLTTAAGSHLGLLRESLTGAVRSGALHEDGGIWRLAEDPVPSGRLVALVEAELVGLGDNERDLLETVALGEPLGSELLQDLVDVDAAARLERRGLLVSTRAGSRVEVRLAVPLHGDVLRHRMTELRIVSVSRALSAAASKPDAAEDVVQLARWRLDSGAATPDLVLEAATAARWRYDFAMAGRLAQAAVSMGAGFEAELLLGQLTCLRGRTADGDAILGGLADRATTDAQRALVATTRIDNAAFYQGDVDRARQIAREAERSMSPGGWHDEVRARHCGLLLATAGPEAAIEAVEPLLARTKGRARVWSCLAASCAYGRRGRHDLAISAAEAGYEAHLDLPRPLEWYPWIHQFFKSEALAHAGRLREADELVTRGYDEGIGSRSREEQAWFSLSRATFVAEQGDVVAASRAAREAQVLFDALGRPQFAQEARVYLATALALAGDAPGAGAALASFHTEGPHPLFMAEVDLALAEGWAAVAAGHLKRAVRLLRAAADRGSATGDLVGAASALHAIARVGFARDVSEAITRIAADTDGILIPARARHVAALATDDGPALETVAGEFDAMGAHLLGGEAACDAAVAFRRVGELARSAAMVLRAREILVSCDGARTPALSAVDGRSAITPAEMQVVLAAVAGATNRQIAAQIGRSVRTVENHLQRVYGKLDVAGRAGLIETFRSGG